MNFSYILLNTNWLFLTVLWSNPSKWPPTTLSTALQIISSSILLSCSDFFLFAKVWSVTHQPRSGLHRLSNWFWRTPRKQTWNISLDKYSSLSNMVLTNSTKHKLQQLCSKVEVPFQRSSLQNRIGVCPSCKDWEVVMKILKRWHSTRSCSILESQYWKVAIVNMMCLLSCNTSPYLTWEVCLWRGNRTGILNSGN